MVGPTFHTHKTLSALLLSVFVVVLVGACSKKPARDPLGGEHVTSMTELYGLSKVPTFEVQLDDSSYEALRNAPREWVMGEFSYDSEVLPQVAVRIKGHRSLRSIDGKPSLKLRFDKGKANKGRRFLGVRRMTLNNLVEDPTMIREYLGYRLAREVGLPVPKAGFAQLRVNGQDYGLYLVLETPDEDFLKRQFGSGDGQLYEGEYGCDLYIEDVPGFDQDAGESTDRQELLLFAQAAQGEPADLWQGPNAPLSLEHLSTFLAFSTFVGDFDGYHHSHNYRLYHPPGDTWHLMSWGLDRSFFKNLSPYSSKGLLAKRCFGSEECRVAYLLALRKVDKAASKLNLITGAKVISSIIAESVNQDVKRPYKAKRINRLRGRLRDFLAQRPADIAEYSSCLDSQGRALDLDQDGYYCLDCDDSDPSVNPGATELCDNRDNNCSGLVDDSPVCPCPTLSVGGTAYAFCNLPMPWREASSHCEALGGHLASVPTRERGKALYEIAQKDVDDRWWVGAHDMQTEGRFHWADGTVVLPEMWAKGQPDNEACNQDCVALRKGNSGSVHDTHCGQHRPFICQLP